MDAGFLVAKSLLVRGTVGSPHPALLWKEKGFGPTNLEDRLEECLTPPVQGGDVEQFETVAVHVGQQQVGRGEPLGVLLKALSDEVAGAAVGLYVPVGRAELVPSILDLQNGRGQVPARQFLSDGRVGLLGQVLRTLQHGDLVALAVKQGEEPI